MIWIIIFFNFRVLIFKELPELVYSGLKRKIGIPTDLEKNLANPEIFD